MKKIVLMPVKNEDWILEYSLSCISVWADYIIVADQNSLDKTPDICKKFKKVIYIRNSNEVFSEGERRQLLLQEARKIDGNNFIFLLDADEILSANFSVFFESDIYKNATPGQSFIFQWINLWKEYQTYRDDGSIWSNSWKHFAFYDNREISYNEGFIHLSRIPELCMINSIKIDSVKVVHFQFIDIQRSLAKQRLYRILEFNKSSKNLLSQIIINIKYFPSKFHPSIGCSYMPPEWYSLYQTRGISTDLIHVSEGSYWYNKDSLVYLRDNIRQFSWLDIWDVNWVELAVDCNIGGDFSDPRNFLQKLYHKLQIFVYWINIMIPQFIKNKL